MDRIQSVAKKFSGLSDQQKILLIKALIPEIINTIASNPQKVMNELQPLIVEEMERQGISTQEMMSSIMNSMLRRRK